jgi:NADH dehydrogenase FAD-containing subunit
MHLLLRLRAGMTMKTQVLIIGGGFAGVATAQKLEKQGIKTTLVDRKDYFEVTYAVLRDVAAPKKTDGKARQYYKDILHGDFIQSGVKELTQTAAVLENGDTVGFDKVVIASGSKYPSLPLAKSLESTQLTTRVEELKNHNSKLRSASHVLIIGGGVVGVELAGEIAYAMPKAKVTLAHNSHVLLNGFKEKAQKKALKQLTDLGVHVEFNTRYKESNKVHTDEVSGKSINPDVAFVAIGTMPNNEFLQQNFSHILNDKGLVNVDSNLAVVGQPNFYAIGDIADVGEAKLGYLALEQGKYLGKALVKVFKGKTTKAYKRNPFMALVPTGQKTGVVQLPFMVSTWKGLVNMKQKDLFISKTYKEFAK